MHTKKLLLALGFLFSISVLAKDTTPALAIANLTDPAKLATLKGERAANPRLQKCVYWLAYAEEQGNKPEAGEGLVPAEVGTSGGRPWGSYPRPERSWAWR